MGLSENKSNGLTFEDLFQKQARRSGFLVKKNPLTARHTWTGRVQLLKGELDFTIVNPHGKVGYFDCKSWGSDHFIYSDIDAKQIERAVLWNEWMVPAGFICWFRPINQIVFFSGRKINQAGPRTRFTVKDGLVLGRFETFDLRALMR